MLIEEIYHKEPLTITQDKTVLEAMEMLMHHRFNGLVVVNETNKVVGVLSVQDIAGATMPPEFRKNPSLAAAMYRQGFFHEQVFKIKNWPVKKIMRKDFVKVTFESNVMEIMADFLFNDLYIIPVMQGKKLLGIVTRSEIKEALAAAMFSPQ